MKKRYFVPETNVVSLNALQMIATSTPSASVDTNGSINPDAFDTRRQHHGFGSGLWEDMK